MSRLGLTGTPAPSATFTAAVPPVVAVVIPRKVAGIQPPPIRIPKAFLQGLKPEVRDYFQKQQVALYLLWQNQSGNQVARTPTKADEFTRRWSLLIRGR